MFLKRFLLASGSLKSVAEAYGVSYPTVRMRLDRLIDKVRVLDEIQPMDDYERLLRGLYAESKLDTETFQQLLRRYHEAQK